MNDSFKVKSVRAFEKAATIQKAQQSNAITHLHIHKYICMSTAVYLFHNNKPVLVLFCFPYYITYMHMFI